MKNIDISKIENLLSNIKELNEIRYIDTEKYFINLKNNLKNYYTDLKIKSETNAEYFNYFECISRYNNGYFKDFREQNHSNFIAYLLNSNADHGQGNLFLKSFISTLVFDGNKNSDFDKADCSIIREKHKIDILIKSNDPNNFFAIIIENKPYSNDEDDQIKIYCEKVIKKYGNLKDKMAVLYLTPYGTAPETNSLPDEYKKYLNKNSVILKLKLSYKNEISNWLNNCLIAIKAPKIKDAIKNYIEFINKIF